MTASELAYIFKDLHQLVCQIAHRTSVILNIYSFTFSVVLWSLDCDGVVANLIRTAQPHASAT